MTNLKEDITAALVATLEPILGRELATDATVRKPMPPDLSSRQMVAYYFGASFLKKYSGSERRTTNEQNDAAWASFEASNEACREWCLRRVHDIESICLGEVRNDLHLAMSDVGLTDYYGLWLQGNVGPGSSRGSKWTDAISKLFGPSISATTHDLHYVWEHCIQRNWSWMSAHCAAPRKPQYRQVFQGSSLTFVPKNVDTARMVATEPTINMWFQLGLGSEMENALKRVFSIDLATQPAINRRLAQEGSITGRLATIDLRGASDRISLKMASYVLPAHVMRWIRALRSPSISYNRQYHELHMVSTMGNGFTFPLQTLLFASIVSGTARAYGVEIHWSGPKRNVGVFGDDIVVPTELYSRVCNILELLGFVINTDKSFSQGPFRESCGGNYFSGHECPPVFLKRDDAPSRCSTINGIVRWSAVTGIPVYRIVSVLDQDYPRVPCYFGNSEGVHVPLTRVQDQSHRGVLRVRHFKSIHPLVRICDKGTTRRISVPRGYGQTQLTEPALHLAFLRGAIRSTSLTKRTARWELALRPQDDHRFRVFEKAVQVETWDMRSKELRDMRITWGSWLTSIRHNLP